jgi:hypothetical protein
MYKIYFFVICISLHAKCCIRFEDPAGRKITTVEISSVEAEIIKCLALQENFTGEIICCDGKPDIKSNFYLYPYIGIYQAILISHFISSTYSFYTFKHLGIEGDTIITQVTESPLEEFSKAHLPNGFKFFVNPVAQRATDARLSIIVPLSPCLEGNTGLVIDPGSDKLYIKTDNIEENISLGRYIGLPNFLSILVNIVHTANTNYYFLHKYCAIYSQQNAIVYDAAKLDKFWIRALKKHLEHEIDWGTYFCGLSERLSKRNELLGIPQSDMLAISGGEIVRQIMIAEQTLETLQELDVGIWK